MQRSNHHHDVDKHGGRRLMPLDPPMTVSQGQAIFRLLCHVVTAGGVIGSSGKIVKQLERDTGSRILVEDNVPNCFERVINVIGFAAIDRKLCVNVDDASGEDFVEASQVQEGLIRVFERVLEVERTDGDGLIGCRLLAGHGQIGAVMGRGGKIIDRIRKNSGAKIKVLPKAQLPACAVPEEEVIQIMGGIVAVKKALVAVSRCLQDHTLTEKVPVGISSEMFPVPKMDPASCSSLSPTLLRNHSALGFSASSVTERILDLDEASAQQMVVFKLLCSSSTVGGVIGKGASIVKALEDETGASIKIASAVVGSKERVATISALENPIPSYSPARTATVRVFVRSIEVGIDHGIIPDLGKGETVSARLLVASNQVDYLFDEGRRLAADIASVPGVEIQLLARELIPNCAEGDDKVVQIVGEYEKVKSALFQATGRLRDSFFAGMLPNRRGARYCSYSISPGTSSHGREKSTSLGLDRLIQGMKHVGLSHESGSHPFPGLHPVQTLGSKNVTPLEDGTRGSTAFGCGLQHSEKPTDTPYRTVEVMVPKHVFDSIYGENGSNLALVKQISGATVVVKDPSDECDGKVIISGTPDQILVAQSVLQAFISN